MPHFSSISTLTGGFGGHSCRNLHLVHRQTQKSEKERLLEVGLLEQVRAWTGEFQVRDCVWPMNETKMKRAVTTCDGRVAQHHVITCPLGDTPHGFNWSFIPGTANHTTDTWLIQKSIICYIIGVRYNLATVEQVG